MLFGRRRVGKTRLLTRWLQAHRGLYSQAIEASPAQQLEQIAADLREGLAAKVAPRTWGELFELLDVASKPPALCLDEFPYLVAADPTLPSVLQRWLDHRTKRSAVILAGSSTRMMNDLFLNRSAPLYGRARKLLEITPMGYGAFCSACRLNPTQRDSFTRFAMVGGVPRYWELLEPKQTVLELAEALFFGPSPLLEFEPKRLLADEGITGLTAPAVLEAVGRGASKPSEIAGRMATAQTNLPRLFQVLMDAALLERQLPFGESARSTKRILYRISDPTLRFWFHVYSPHRTRWSGYPAGDKLKLLEDHASTVFEDQMRARWPGAARYWEAGAELDLVREDGRGLVVAEIKWKKLSVGERQGVRASLETKFRGTALAAKYPAARFDVLDQSELSALARSR